MAVKDISAGDYASFEYPSYKSTSRMKNYGIIYDTSINMPRCSFYTNSLKNVSDSLDEKYVVELQYEHRLDLISYKFYGTSIYDWAIADANNIENPIKDVIVGKELIIPSLGRI